MVSGGEGRAVVLEAWVRLGEELGEISEAFGALVCSGIKEEEMLIFLAEKGGELGSFRLGIALGMHTGEGSVFWCLLLGVYWVFVWFGGN